MRVAILAFDGCNEIDVFVPFSMLNQLSAQGWKAELTCLGSHVTTLNGATLQAQQPLAFASEADAVILTGGLYARAIAEDGSLLARLQLDPLRQLIGAQGSGSLLLARLGMLGNSPACSDEATRPWIVEAGVRVIDEPFHCRGPIATAGGSLASQYLATWMMVRGADLDAAAQALMQLAPVGAKSGYVDRVMAVVRQAMDAEGDPPVSV